jgi:hypothetical protein
MSTRFFFFTRTRGKHSDAVFRGKFDEVTSRFKGDKDEIDADRNTPMQYV